MIPAGMAMSTMATLTTLAKVVTAISRVSVPLVFTLQCVLPGTLQLIKNLRCERKSAFYGTKIGELRSVTKFHVWTLAQLLESLIRYQRSARL